MLKPLMGESVSDSVEDVTSDTGHKVTSDSQSDSSAQ